MTLTEAYDIITRANCIIGKFKINDKEYLSSIRKEERSHPYLDLDVGFTVFSVYDNEYNLLYEDYNMDMNIENLNACINQFAVKQE